MNKYEQLSLLLPENSTGSNQLISQLRTTTTLANRQEIYSNSEIIITTVSPHQLSHTAKYVLRTNLHRITQLHATLLPQGINIFNLDDIVSFPTFNIAPPIVEIHDNQLLIIDGLHRCYLALQQGLRIKVAIILSPAVSLFAYPQEWSQVLEYDQKPNIPHLLRDLRPEFMDNQQLIRSNFRDFSNLGSSGRRPLNK